MENHNAFCQILREITCVSTNEHQTYAYAILTISEIHNQNSEPFPKISRKRKVLVTQFLNFRTMFRTFAGHGKCQFLFPHFPP